jgi:Mce-associated membrane protein
MSKPSAADPPDASTDTDPEKTVTIAPSSSEGSGAAGKQAPLLPIVLAALCVAAAVVVGLLGWKVYTGSHTNHAEAAALDAARTRSVFVLSYAPATVDADIEKARQQLSGTFASQFDQLVNAVVLPAAKQQGLTSKVEVTHAAIMEYHPDHADVLLFMHQTVSSTTQPAQDGTIQVKITVTKTPDGQWLISNLQPI